MAQQLQPFFPWLFSQITSIHSQQLGVYLVVGVIGMLAHWARLYLTGEYSQSFWYYLFGDQPKKTLLTLGTFVSSGFTYLFTGAVATASWPALMGLAFTTGYSLDSMLNRGTKTTKAAPTTSTSDNG